MTATDPQRPLDFDDEVQLNQTGMYYKTIQRGPPTRTFLDGSEYWVIELRSVRIGLGHFRPGWVWSEHAGAQTDEESQNHIGIVRSGRIAVKDAEGKTIEIGPGDAFEVGPGHDAWVIGDEVCVALDVSFKKSD